MAAGPHEQHKLSDPDNDVRHLHDSKVENPVLRWIDQRMPVISMIQLEYGSFPTPRNFNYFWNFGALAMVTLAIMIATGVILSMQYTANTHLAFDSVERIMRDVNYGWLLRYAHSNGASMFFIVTYIHMWRTLYYGSYKSPRELLWMLGVVLFILMMATAFMGYVLPWGQMSFWGATVITNLFSALPLIGEHIVTWLWGGFSVDNPTLNRFFSLHFLLPFLIVGVTFLHVVALHITGSNNPLGIEPKTKKDTIPFHPYYTVKDSVGIVVYFIVFAILVFFMPNYLGHPDNYIPANPLVTPAHIVPEWYFLPFYAILRAVPDKLGGVALMGGALVILFFLPWLDGSPVRSMRFRPIAKWLFLLWTVNFFVLGWVGGKPAEQPYILIAQIGTAYYFAYFLVLLPLLAKFEKPLPLPESIASAVLKRRGGGPLPAGATAKPMEKA
ncbi:cytochrome b N-terminal domain-containing protein [Roseomonas sp. SSH11]|uniref:Cytochrome b n=1 Tax=Pararoseomonas baculiformis TaxID=2820812 RepID=A0ABS4A9Y4_9PROT|nr:cytochrome b N-terminal domain-containing protein [Pararoseomonas baculiformis]